MILGGLSQTIPDWLIIWIAVAAAVCWIIGARRPAIALTLLPAGKWLVAPLFAPVVAALPWWAIPLADAIAILLLTQAAIALVFGRAVAATVTATMLLRVLDLLFFAPFRGARWIVRSLLP